jgi:hypothetical protein
LTLDFIGLQFICLHHHKLQYTLSKSSYQVVRIFLQYIRGYCGQGKQGVVV